MTDSRLPFFATVEEVAALLRCEAEGTADPRENRLKQARHWLHVNGVPCIRRGKRLLVRRDDLEAALDESRENSLADLREARA
ncbi:MAG TPA: hypothetical protein VMY35_19160 [Phycisphaerae bacterium]|nr:hypothetical protein [Phycisphaerae bacterium]